MRLLFAAATTALVAHHQFGTVGATISTPTLTAPSSSSSPRHQPTVIVYGASGAACVAAVAASRSAHAAGGSVDVKLLSQTGHVGGMLTGGLQHTDSANDTVIQGITREFFVRTEQQYVQPTRGRVACVPLACFLATCMHALTTSENAAHTYGVLRRSMTWWVGWLIGRCGGLALVAVSLWPNDTNVLLIGFCFRYPGRPTDADFPPGHSPPGWLLSLIHI